MPDTPILNSDGSALPFDATTGDRARSPAAPSATDKIPYFALLIFMIGTTFYQQRQMQKASPPGRGERPAAGHPQADADHVRDLRLHVPGRPHAVLDRLEPVADRPAVRPAPGRPHRARTRWSGGSPSNATKNANKPARSPGFMARMQERARSRPEGRPDAQEAGRRAGEAHRRPRRRAQGPAAEGPAPQHRWGSKPAATPSGRYSQDRRHTRSGRHAQAGAHDPNTDPRKRGGGSDGQGDGEAGS